MLDKLKIRNFKSIKQMEIECNNQFNVIIGENNIGKTTIFEAIHLWKICYDACIQKRDKKSFYATSKNIPFSDNEYLRIFEDKDLVNNELYRNSKDIEIELTIKYCNEVYKLGFQVSKVLGLDNAYLQTSYIDKNEFNRFSNTVKNSEFNLTNILIICESRPIANIVSKEPYMYKSQVLDKISRGKGYEVLRNKIIKTPQTKELIENHISNVMGNECKFSEVDKENKTYIRLLINGTNILSQGSGFLQIAEIFSSLEYINAGMYILLIDEPDSHLHMSLQKSLISELRSIENSQTFVITHNHKFISNVPDDEILFIDNKRKEAGIINHLQSGYKNLILENLLGEMDKVDKLSVAEKIILCEGDTDVVFLNNLLQKYAELNNIDLPCLFIEKIQGIDTLNDKLLSYSRAYNQIVSDNAKWIVIRDSDCLPISKQIKSGNKSKTYITSDSKEVLFQKGYGIESTLVTEMDKLALLITDHYELESIETNTILQIINQTVNEYATGVRDIMNPVYNEILQHFTRQKNKRLEYKDLSIQDMLSEINQNNIEYIMTKPILNMFLASIHSKVAEHYDVQSDTLNNNTLMTFYLGTIDDVNKIFQCHRDLIDKLIN
ncbi:MAG: AAA family ATPase [Bacillota bacterium]|nr:AAA family ATPase [Bacillota bacterium]